MGGRAVSAPEFTPDDCVKIFHAALQTGDARGVEAALTLLAVLDPHRAQNLLDTARVAVAIAQAADVPEEWQA
jgi:hypothetical protein